MILNSEERSHCHVGMSYYFYCTLCNRKFGTQKQNSQLHACPNRDFNPAKYNDINYNGIKYNRKKFLFQKIHAVINL